jgi:hypothetical protein
MQAKLNKKTNPIKSWFFQNKKTNEKQTIGVATPQRYN